MSRHLSQGSESIVAQFVVFGGLRREHNALVETAIRCEHGTPALDLGAPGFLYLTTLSSVRSMVVRFEDSTARASVS
jgi:hypothetical protein